LEEIPLVSVEILEDGDGAVGFFARNFQELDAIGLHKAVVSPEVVGMEKQEDTTTSLIADLLELSGSVGLREEQAGAARAGGSNNDPAFPAGEKGIFDQAETEDIGEEGEGFVVIADEESDMSQ
jgi:hypothetical protein